ncbi:helix-turn-helix domain-containing protein [Streptomyces sp. NPDC088258]|uniref:helix-turn-helix domain-containing protein n=1 Tax=Streptomyces sp. NPDC088258 TaxID=3365849 RepID=UPI00381483B9
MTDTTGESWLELLLRDASAEELLRHGAELARSLDSGTADRETASALRLKVLLHQQTQRAAELSALNDIAIRLAALSAPDELLPEIVDQARRLLGADLAYLGLVEDGVLRLKVTSGALTPELVGLAVPLSRGLAGEVLERAAPRWTADYRTDPRFRHDGPADAAAVAENMRGLLGVPLRLRGRVLGALFAAKRQRRDFGEHDVTLLSALAAHAAIAIENARAVTDLNATNAHLARRSAELEQTLRWDQRLTRVVLRGGGVEDLLREIRAIAGGEVRFVTSPPVPEEGAGRAVRPVVAGERTFGALVLTGAAAPDDPLLLERAAPALALALVAERAVAEATRRTRDVLLLDLLTTSSGRPQDMRLAGLDATASYAVLVADPASARARVERMEWPEGTVMAEHGTRLVVVAPADAPERLQQSWPGGPDVPTAGIAGPARGGAELARSFVEARRTLEALQALERYGQASTAAQLGLYRILLDHTGRADLEARFRQLLGPVLAEEARRKVPLLDTLHAYLAHGGRARATADALAVHVNTLYQRLSTLDGILGESWRSPDRALELRVLLRLRTAAAALDGGTGG